MDVTVILGSLVPSSSLLFIYCTHKPTQGCNHQVRLLVTGWVWVHAHPLAENFWNWEAMGLLLRLFLEPKLCSSEPRWQNSPWFLLVSVYATLFRYAFKTRTHFCWVALFPVLPFSSLYSQWHTEVEEHATKNGKGLVHLSHEVNMMGGKCVCVCGGGGGVAQLQICTLNLRKSRFLTSQAE